MLNADMLITMSKKVYIETYGCQMNVADSEVVVSILSENGYAAYK